MLSKDSNRLDEQTEFLEIMHETCNKLWTLDPRLVILAWVNEESKPIHKGKAFPNN